jgi:hypothetical protein
MSEQDTVNHDLIQLGRDGGLDQPRILVHKQRAKQRCKEKFSPQGSAWAPGSSSLWRYTPMPEPFHFLSVHSLVMLSASLDFLTISKYKIQTSTYLIMS